MVNTLSGGFFLYTDWIILLDGGSRLNGSFSSEGDDGWAIQIHG